MWYGNNRILLCVDESTAKASFDSRGVQYAANGCFIECVGACKKKVPAWAGTLADPTLQG